MHTEDRKNKTYAGVTHYLFSTYATTISTKRLKAQLTVSVSFAFSVQENVDGHQSVRSNVETSSTVVSLCRSLSKASLTVFAKTYGANA